MFQTEVAIAEGTKRDGSEDQATEAVVVERDGESNPVVATHPMPPWKSVLVRATRSSIDAFLATNIFATAFMENEWQTSLKKALIVAGIAFLSASLRNTGELLGKWDQTNPGFRA
jgi:hypothetical protein